MNINLIFPVIVMLGILGIAAGLSYLLVYEKHVKRFFEKIYWKAHLKIDSFKRKRINKFKNKYFWSNANKNTIVARRMFIGYCRMMNIDGKFGVIAVDAEIKNNQFLITIITDKPGWFIGKRGINIDNFESYCKTIFMQETGKRVNIKLNLLESNYWPESFEELEELNKEYEDQYFEDINN